MTPYDDLVPVLLAGGSGTRLWPLSRRQFPKHLIGLLEEASLLQTTVDRVLAASHVEKIVTVGAASQAVLLERQLTALDPKLLGGLILEPSARNTAAACAVAAHVAAARFGPATVLWICAADHVMTAPDALYRALAPAIDAARAGNLVTFGIEPSYPEPGFGYIKIGEPWPSIDGCFNVAAFIEKPPRDEAAAMLHAGGHLWNSGMFVFRADRFLEELAIHAPAIAAATEAALDGGLAAKTGPWALPAAAYAAIPSQPVDKAVMERSANLAVVPCDPGWSDVGSWHAIWEKAPHDAAGNAAIGDALLIESVNCLVSAQDRLVAVAGQRDLAVIATADAVYVGPRENSALVKEVAETLLAGGRSEAEVHPVLPMAWGTRRQLDAADGRTVERFDLDAGAECVLPNAEGVHVVVLVGRVAVDPEGIELHAGAQHAGATLKATSGEARLCALGGPASLLVVGAGGAG